ncbi:MAG: NADPH-dependent 7-cyano-7-deazaguanine reductase [Cellvibrionaceae bacterium]
MNVNPPHTGYSDLALGQSTVYESSYNPKLLHPVARKELRAELGIRSELPFSGMDLWTGYELSWLEPGGKPRVAVAEFFVPASSENLIESKSFKLYLNSFNQTVFKSVEAVEQALEQDLSEVAGAPVAVTVKSLSHATQDGLGKFPGECIDDLPVNIDCYTPHPELLKLEGDTIEDVEDGASVGVQEINTLDSDGAQDEVQEALYSNLLKSNCPVTGQPDWATVWIHYRGRKIDREALLKYIVSYREHQDFHEHCVEKIFLDIKRYCHPEALTVYARYTRRGGLDINPFRTDCHEEMDDIRLARQ